MLCRHADARLKRVAEQPGYTGGFGADVVKAYRKRIQLIRAAKDERDFYALKSLHYEKLKGNRKNQHSMRLNDQWRLILEIVDDAEGVTVVIVGIEDYH